MKKKIFVQNKYLNKYASDIIIYHDFFIKVNLKIFTKLKKNARFFIITDSNISKLYLQKVFNFFSLFGSCNYFIVEPCESSKSLDNIIGLSEAIMSHSPKKSDFIVALGGGVILDVAGFLASIMLRGMRLINIPTTLLAMIDASIGGKNGVNYKGYKNVFGSIYPAHYIILDLSFLSTLPDHEYLQGISEIIKIAICCDKNFFNFLNANSTAILERQVPVLVRMIKHAIRLKNRVVKKDLMDEGKRKILNFGHSVAHAIEAISNNEIPHGYAVSIGMIMEMEIAARLGYTKADLIKKLHSCLALYNLPTELPNGIDREQIVKIIMSKDKKSLGDRIDFPVLRGIGDAVLKKVKFSDL